jgi:hypothetical protein
MVQGERKKDYYFIKQHKALKAVTLIEAMDDSFQGFVLLDSLLP